MEGYFCVQNFTHKIKTHLFCWLSKYLSKWGHDVYRAFSKKPEKCGKFGLDRTVTNPYN